MLDPRGLILGLTTTRALVTIQEMVDHSHKWHEEEGDREMGEYNSTRMSIIPNKLKSLNRDMRNLKENVHDIKGRYESGNNSPLGNNPKLKEILGKYLEESCRRQVIFDEWMKRFRENTDKNRRKYDFAIKGLEENVARLAQAPNAPMYFCRTKHNHIWAEIRPTNANTLAVGGGKWWWYWWVMVETMVTVVDVVRQWGCGGVEMMWMVDLDWRWLCGDEGGGGCDSEARRKCMRTRSSSNLVGETSTNLNSKGHNRRRSKQRVEPFSTEESPVVTMADQRTMVELLRAPIEGYAEAIVVPPILAEQFELKHSLINLVTSKQFFSFEKQILMLILDILTRLLLH
nr:reverse transcriptase domain-containing protein [Tanacetum cinerariifolium]